MNDGTKTIRASDPDLEASLQKITSLTTVDDAGVELAVIEGPFATYDELFEAAQDLLFVGATTQFCHGAIAK